MDEEEMFARWDRQDVPADVRRLPDGTWVAQKLGCTGLGADEVEAVYDLNTKVGLAYDKPTPHDEAIRQGMEDRGVRETHLRILRKLTKRPLL